MKAFITITCVGGKTHPPTPVNLARRLKMVAEKLRNRYLGKSLHIPLTKMAEGIQYTVLKL